MGASGGEAAGSARVVTISATYGSSGSLIAPALATRLGLPFADRLIPALGGEPAAECGEQLTEEERVASRRTSFLDRLAHLTGGLGLPVPAGDDIQDHVR
ncbi:MAG TPA: cytidylate kinase family protein, partial [Acidimicrobiia bacterium]|nr:cytidylate kinase family protein [Acidimicrobiia bacterium]